MPTDPSPPPGAEPVDHSAALDATVADLEDVLPRPAPPRPVPIPGQSWPTVSGGTTQAERLIQLAEAADLFHTPEGRGYGTVPVGGHRETWPLGQQGFRDWLIKRFYDIESKPPGRQGVEAALEVLRAQARYEGVERPVFVRLGRGEDGANYLDLGSATWDSVKITANGWQPVPDAPVRFRRPKGMAALPRPEPGGSLELLRPLVNLDDDQWTLFIGWLVAACWHRGPYPVLTLEGEQGSAKSGLARIVRALVDPCTAPLRSAPREERNLMIAATNSLIVAYDNLSSVPEWLSDALCRLSTGGGMSVRTLYADDDETIFNVQRPVVLTGIANLAERDDLRDRALILMLKSIPETARRDEAALWTEFQVVRPRILGALLDAVSTAMRRLDGVQLSRLPRMADFARLATAAEPALGLPDGGFLLVYDASLAEAVEAGIELHQVAKAVRDFATVTRDPDHDAWKGTATELLTALTERAPELVRKARDWPTTPTKLSTEITRVTPALRRVGVMVDRVRSTDSRRTRLLRIWKKSGLDADGRAADAGTCQERPECNDMPAPHLASGADASDAPDALGPLFPFVDADELEERLAIEEEARAASPDQAA